MFKELKLTITHLSWHFSQFDSYLTSKFANISILYKYQPSFSSFNIALYIVNFSLGIQAIFFIQVEPYLRPPLIHLGITKFLIYGSCGKKKRKKENSNLYTGTKYTKTLRAYFLKSLPERSNRSLVSLWGVLSKVEGRSFSMVLLDHHHASSVRKGKEVVTIFNKNLSSLRAKFLCTGSQLWILAICTAQLQSNKLCLRFALLKQLFPIPTKSW